MCQQSFDPFKNLKKYQLIKLIKFANLADYMKQQYWAVVMPMIGVFVLLLDCRPVLLPLWIVMKTGNLLLQVVQDDVYASVKRTQFPTMVCFHHLLKDRSTWKSR